jgi:Xaa-Pro aminopeptidase
VSGWGRLESPPARPGWEFPPEEYRRRVELTRRRMAAAGIDCLFLTSEKNIRYLAGFHSQTWVSPTRPRYVLLPLAGEPVAVVPSSNVAGMRATSWIEDVRSWPAPRPADDGVSLVVDALAAIAGPSGQVAAELGPEMRVQVPIADLLRIRAARGRDFVDAGPVLRPVRMVKSALEIARVREIAGVASEAFAQLAPRLRPGLTEREVARLLHGLLIELGADTVPYVVPVSGPHGYEQINMGPTDRRLEAGDLLIIDVGATWRGYFCDFDRNFALGRASEEMRAAYARVFEATEAGLAAVQPGRTAAAVWAAMAAVVDPGGRRDTPVGRMGHGLGLDLTEPPSLAPDDPTVLEAGMVLTLEPSLTLPGAGGLARRLMVHEENVVVTATGCELLTRRAPAALPVV